MEVNTLILGLPYVKPTIIFFGFVAYRKNVTFPAELYREIHVISPPFLRHPPPMPNSKLAGFVAYRSKPAYVMAITKRKEIMTLVNWGSCGI